MAKDPLEAAHEAKIDALLRELGGRGRESDWALTRALVHRAVHFAADRNAGEFCRVATLLAEMIAHAHELQHGSPAAHDDVVHGG